MRCIPKWNTLAARSASAPASRAAAKSAKVPAPPLAINGTFETERIAVIIPMSISKPKRWFETFAIATTAAFAGALVAYAIGNFMFHKLGVHIFELSGVDDPKKFLAIFYKKSTFILLLHLKYFIKNMGRKPIS